MGAFGPGTTKPLKIKRSKEFKATGNAIENKNRPESLYIIISTWVKPKLSLLKAKNNLSADPEELAVDIARDFDKEMSRIKKKLSYFFDSSLFDTSSIIFTYDFSPSFAKPGKRQFIEMEINIDTINDIDSNEQPIPNPGTGKVNNIPFKNFIGSMEKAVNGILSLDPFDNKKSGMDFSTSKGDK